MARTLTIDGADLLRVILMRERAAGAAAPTLSVHAEYVLKAGAQVVQTKHVEVTKLIPAQRLAQLTAGFDAVGQDVSTQELA